MNGHMNGRGYTFANGSDNIKALSNSKMSLQSLQSLRSNSSVNSNRMNGQLVNGHATQPPANVSCQSCANKVQSFVVPLKYMSQWCMYGTVVKVSLCSTWRSVAHEK